MFVKHRKKQTLRNNEYYDMQNIFDKIYRQSKNGKTFNKLLEIITSKNNILLAYRNIKDNKGSETSRSSSYNSSGGSNANVSNSMNLMARPLLTEDEVSRIEYPYVLVMHSGYHPAIMELPDISEWLFNKVLGLGDKEHNRILREYREKKRIPKKAKDIELWNIWKTYDESEKTEQDKDNKKQTGTGGGTQKPTIRTPAPSEHSKSDIEMQEVESFANTNINKNWKTGAEMFVSGENIVELFESMKQATKNKNKNNEKRIDVL